MQKFVEERNWEGFHNTKNLAASISIEAAELLELFQWLDTSEAESKADSDVEFRENISDEMADVILYVLSLANRLNLDVSLSVRNKLEKNRRKYPASEFKGKFVTKSGGTLQA